MKSATSIKHPAPARPCLDPLFAALHAGGRQRALRLCEAGIVEHSRTVAAAEKRKRETDWETFVARYKLACHVVFLEEEGLLELRGCSTPESYLGSHWPGEPVSKKHLLGFLSLGRRISEEVALSGKAGISLLSRVARVHGPCLEMLVGLILAGYGAEKIGRGADAAWEALRYGAPDAVALSLAREAVEGKRKRRPACLPAEAKAMLGLSQNAERMTRSVVQVLALGRPADAQAVVDRLQKTIDEWTDPPPQDGGSGGGPGGPDRRRTERSDPANPGLAEEKAAPPPAAAPPPPPPAAVDAAVDKEDTKEDTEEAPPPPARPPDRAGPHESFFPVPYPADDYHPTPAESIACCLLVALWHANTLVEPILEAWGDGDGISIHLQLRVRRALNEFSWHRDAVQSRLQTAARRGHDELQAAVKQGYGDTLQELLPIPNVDEVEFLPMLYLSIEVIDPFGDDEATWAEQHLWILLGLVAAAQDHLLRFQEHYDAGVEVADDLCYQLDERLKDCTGYFGMLSASFTPGSLEAEAEEAAQAERDAPLEVLAARADQGLVVLGEDQLPVRQYTKVATTLDGRHVAVTQTTGLVFIGVGPQGKGKTNLGNCVREGVHLDLPGLGRMEQFGRSFVFSSDWNRGAANPQHLCGLYPNPDPAQWQLLKNLYQLRLPPHKAAYRRMTALCMPGTAQGYREMYPELCERGLQFKELGFAPQDTGSLFYRLLLPGGAEGGGKARAQWRTFIDSVIGYHGQDVRPELIEGEFTRAKLRGANEAAVRAQLETIKGLMDPDGVSLTELLLDPAPVVALLESAFLGQELLLPVQIAAINALSRPGPGGVDPLRWFILHELGKQLSAMEGMGQYLRECAAEVRHRPCSFYLETHLIEDLPPALVSLATGILHFAGNNKADYEKLQRLYAPYLNVPFPEIARLPPGHARVAFQRATDPLFTRTAPEVVLRPACTWSGGETLSVVE